jgi:dTDP-4-amino-4,6-dideoxygalactose transaminase
MAHPNAFTASDSAAPVSASPPHTAQDSSLSKRDPTPDPKSELIPVMRPRLPLADRLLPYLQRIDDNRIYANFGPLVLELEARLAEHFGLPANALVTASSGTTALVAAILAAAPPANDDRPYALMPGYTFVATAVAAERCGYQPVLVDIDDTQWMLDPDKLRQHPMLDQTGVIIVVAPFGRAFDQGPWREFRDSTGIPVIVDAAAGFEAVSEQPGRCLGPVPVMLSFHATKSFATGEGGCIICSDVNLVQRVGQALNYGFYDSRLSRTPSTNGKMSEIHAAVGLAELDDWPLKREAMRAVADEYRRQLDNVALADRLIAAPEVSASYVLVRARDADEAGRLQQSLLDSRIGYRLWYGAGLREQPHFSTAPGGPLPVTETIAPLIIGVPTAPDLNRNHIAQVIRALVAGCRTD